MTYPNKPFIEATFWDHDGEDMFAAAQFTGSGSVHITVAQVADDGINVDRRTIALDGTDAVAFGEFIATAGRTCLAYDTPRPS